MNKYNPALCLSVLALWLKIMQAAFFCASISCLRAEISDGNSNMPKAKHEKSRYKRQQKISPYQKKQTHDKRNDEYNKVLLEKTKDRAYPKNLSIEERIDALIFAGEAITAMSFEVSSNSENDINQVMKIITGLIKKITLSECKTQHWVRLPAIVQIVALANSTENEDKLAALQLAGALIIETESVTEVKLCNKIITNQLQDMKNNSCDFLAKQYSELPLYAQAKYMDLEVNISDNQIILVLQLLGQLLEDTNKAAAKLMRSQISYFINKLNPPVNEDISRQLPRFVSIDYIIQHGDEKDKLAAYKKAGLQINDFGKNSADQLTRLISAFLNRLNVNSGALREICKVPYIQAIYLSNSQDREDNIMSLIIAGQLITDAGVGAAIQLQSLIGGVIEKLRGLNDNELTGMPPYIKAAALSNEEDDEHLLKALEIAGNLTCIPRGLPRFLIGKV